MSLADLVPNEVQDQGLPLVGIQFTWEGNLYFSVGRSVRPFVLIGNGPEPSRFTFGP